jgi:CheY-like chemotaxis protein
MQIKCTQCRWVFTLQDKNLPEHEFDVNCPKCRLKQTVKPPKKAEPTLAGALKPMSGNTSDLVSQLVALLSGQGRAPGASQMLGAANWQQRQTLACLADPDHTKKTQELIDANGYAVTVCDTAAQAIELMRDTRVDVALLDPQFDAPNQGGITILRHINSLMPKQRRRIFLVLVSSQVKTLDTYTAFLNGVNLTVNASDIGTLDQVLERGIRNFNELYRCYNAAAGLTPF